MIQPLGRVPLPSRGWATPTAVPMDAQRVGPFKKTKKTSCRHETQLRQRNSINMKFRKNSKIVYGQGVGGTRAAANEQLLQILKSLPLNPQSPQSADAISFSPESIKYIKYLSLPTNWRIIDSQNARARLRAAWLLFSGWSCCKSLVQHVSASFQSQLVFTKTKLLLLRLRNLPTAIQAS